MTPPKRSSPKPGDESVSFPALHSLNPVTNVATIAAEFKGLRVLCRVKISDLQKKYGNSPGEPMQVVTDNRELIENVARRLIEEKKFEADGSITIHYQNL